MSSDPISGLPEKPSDRRCIRLTPERIEVLVECVIAGRTRKETAIALGGASLRSVSRWKTDERVLAAVERVRNPTEETLVEEVLLRLLDSDDERIVLGAIREKLRWRIRLASEAPPPPDANEVVLPLEPGMRWVANVREEPFE